jgi:hypothetical protein
LPTIIEGHRISHENAHPDGKWRVDSRRECMKPGIDDLQEYVHKGIADICPHRYVGHNNCAHFVGHVLELQLGILCNLSLQHEEGRASIRVNDIYNNLYDTGLWSARPQVGPNQSLLIFVTSAKNVSRDDMMNDSPFKHVGIFVGDRAYNYSNHYHQVVCDTVDQFFEKCDAVYPGDDITLYYGVAE